jgi:hypothetical protein
VTLVTARYFQDCVDTPRPVASDTGWHEVRAGLSLVTWGYIVLLALGLLGLLLGRLAEEVAMVTFGRTPRHHDLELVLTLAVFLRLLAAALAFLLLLLGQWRCLMYASERQNAKELIYVSLQCLLFGGLLHAIGVCLDGAETQGALHEGIGRLRRINWWSGGNLLQLGGVVLIVLSGLLFIQFLRNVSICLGDRARDRALGINILAAGLLLGGSIGAVLCFERLEGRPDFFEWLGLSWVLWFVWHLLGVMGVRRRLDQRRARLAEGRAEADAPLPLPATP